MNEIKVCPVCNRSYLPELDRKHPELLIQEEFPKAPAWQREQWITGVCSDRCWDRFLGIEREDEPSPSSLLEARAYLWHQLHRQIAENKMYNAGSNSKMNFQLLESVSSFHWKKAGQLEKCLLKKT